MFAMHGLAQKVGWEGAGVGELTNLGSKNAIEPNKGDLFFDEGIKEEKKGNLNEALTAFGKAGFEYSSTNQLGKYANSLFRMSNVHLKLGNYKEAEHVVLNAMLKTYVKMRSKSGEMASYGQLGQVYLASGKLTQSMWFYTQQGILARQLANNHAQIASMIGVANVNIKRKAYKKAALDLANVTSLAKNFNIDSFNIQIRMAKALLAKQQGAKS